MFQLERVDFIDSGIVDGYLHISKPVPLSSPQCVVHIYLQGLVVCLVDLHSIDRHLFEIGPVLGNAEVEVRENVAVEVVPEGHEYVRSIVRRAGTLLIQPKVNNLSCVVDTWICAIESGEVSVRHHCHAGGIRVDACIRQEYPEASTPYVGNRLRNV